MRIHRMSWDTLRLLDRQLRLSSHVLSVGYQWQCLAERPGEFTFPAETLCGVCTSQASSYRRDECLSVQVTTALA